MQSDELVNLHRLANTIGLPAAWIKTEALAGRLPCLKIGRQLRFSVAAVSAALLLRAGGGTAVAKDVAEVPSGT